MMPATMVDFEKFEQMVLQNTSKYQQANPYPNVVFENVLPQENLEILIDEFPAPDEQLDWRLVNSVDPDGSSNQKNKMGFSNENRLGRYTRQLIHELNSGPFLQLIETLTGIDALLPDPTLQGAGIHQYMPNSVLRIHADFSIHKKYHLDRRINLLLYLNDDWEESWGGHLELWDAAMKKCEKRVSPIANTMVIFSTSSVSFHGMPDILNCPHGVTRKSLALYYYSNGRPEGEADPTIATLWQRRPVG